jgi:hypothetical protein
MWVRAVSKQRFGEMKQPYLHLECIASVEVGHDGNMNIKMSNGEEFVVSGASAKTLLAFIEENTMEKGG